MGIQIQGNLVYGARVVLRVCEREYSAPEDRGSKGVELDRAEMSRCCGKGAV
jgi:hypothetical protein